MSDPLWTLGIWILLIGLFAAGLLAIESLLPDMKDFEEEE